MAVPRFTPKVFLLVPTMACQAGCRYCYAKKTDEHMSRDTASAVIDFMDNTSRGKRFKIIFHGGEPLLAGKEFYKFILPKLRDRFGRRAALAIQSNLWSIDEEFASLFRSYEVEVSTSIDGYREMCDGQRGEGYYDKAQRGAAIMAAEGRHVGRICTFTADHYRDAERVFREAEAPYTIHGAVPTYGELDSPQTITPEQFTKVLRDTYHAYKRDLSHTRVSLLDSMASALLNKHAGLCTFSSCLGQYAAITPNGDLYSCQRFSGIKQFSLGNVMKGIDEAAVVNSEAWQRLWLKTEEMKEACGDCLHFSYCNGGCLYSAFTDNDPKDPYCETYKTLFDEMLADLGREIASVMQNTECETPVLCMAGEKPHPYDERVKTDRIRRALDLGKFPGENYGKVKYSENQLNKVFFNITRRCPLKCSHCWVGARENSEKELPVERLVQLIQDSVNMQFRRIIITGGEPLMYRHFDELMDWLTGLDRKGSELILRSSFAFSINETRMRKIAAVFDRVIISIDGTKMAHDARRGKGSYEKTVRNLELFSEVGDSRKLGIWSVLSRDQLEGTDAEAVRALAEKFHVGFVHFDPLKPMGYACFGECDQTADLPAKAEELRVRTNCGLGHILHVEPDGKAYACYACTSPEALLADLSRDPLSCVKEKLFAYMDQGVDTNEKCSACSVRYLCGGLCLVYRPNPNRPDSGEFDCEARKKRLKQMVRPLFVDQPESVNS